MSSGGPSRRPARPHPHDGGEEAAGQRPPPAGRDGAQPGAPAVAVLGLGEDHRPALAGDGQGEGGVVGPGQQAVLQRARRRPGRPPGRRRRRPPWPGRGRRRPAPGGSPPASLPRAGAGRLHGGDAGHLGRRHQRPGRAHAGAVPLRPAAGQRGQHRRRRPRPAATRRPPAPTNRAMRLPPPPASRRPGRPARACARIERRPCPATCARAPRRGPCGPGARRRRPARRGGGVGRRRGPARAGAAGEPVTPAITRFEGDDGATTATSARP